MNVLRQIRQVIYRLKRNFGTPATLTRVISSSVDLQTGKIVRVVNDYSIRRAVILPKSLLREFLPKGHTIDMSKRICLIDRADLSTDIGSADQLTIGGAKYSIAPIESDLSDENYLLELKRVEGQ